MNLLASITRHPRYHPELEELDKKTHWSKDIWISNIFRAYEWLFGRGYGIRPEISTSFSKDKDGNIELFYEIYTLEAFCSFIEWKIREFFKLKFVPFRLVLVQPARLFTAPQVGNPWMMFAIAYDAIGGTSANANSITFSHTCTGSNLILFVGTSDEIGTATPHVTGITYNAISLTQIAELQNPGTAQNYFVYLHYLINPTTGANNVVISANAVINLRGDSISYSGAKQTGQPDASGTGSTVAGGATDLPISLTVVASNCWIVSIGQGLGNPPTAGTGLSNRNTLNLNITMGDSNGTVSSGANTVHWTYGSALPMAGIAASIIAAPGTPNQVINVNTAVHRASRW